MTEMEWVDDDYNLSTFVMSGIKKGSYSMR